MSHGNLSAKQRDIALYGTAEERWTIVSGPVGAGKTYAGLVGFVLWQSRWANANFGLLCKTQKQLEALLADDLTRLLGETPVITDRGYFTLGGADGTTNKVWCFLGTDRRAEPRIRGFNFSGFVADELTTMPFSLLAAINARVRVGEGGRIIGLTNPDGPLHPVKRRYIDNAADHDAAVHMTQIADNPALPDSYIASLSQHYDGHMKLRMVDGVWAAASGLVYPRAHERSLEAPDETMVAYDVAIDVGESSVTHALLAGRTASGMTWIVAESRHDHVTQGTLSEREQIHKIMRDFDGPLIHSWIVDPAAKRFRQELLRQLGHGAQVGKAYNSFTEGVEEVNYWLSIPSLRFYGEQVPHLMAELGGLQWDEGAAEKGRDVPVESPDHGTDALRYLVLTRAIHEAGGHDAWQASRRRMKEVAK